MDLKTMLDAKDAVIPTAGFNLVELDEYASPGEGLTLLSHHETRPEAETARTAYLSENPGTKTAIYASTDR